MILWTPIRTTLKTVVGTLSGVTTLWKDEPRPYLPDQYALLTIKDVIGKGTDEFPWLDSTAPVVPTEELTQYIRGERLFTLSVKVDSLSQLDALTAWEFVERLRSGWMLRSTTDTLAAANLGFVRMLLGTVIEETIDERARSVAIVDVGLRYVFAAGTSERETYIETFEVTEETPP